MSDKFDVVGRMKKFAQCTCCLLVGLGFEATADDRLSGFSDTMSLADTSTLSFSNTADGQDKTKVMNTTQALWAIMFEDGVRAFSGEGALTDPGTRAGFVIQRDDSDLSFQYRF